LRGALSRDFAFGVVTDAIVLGALAVVLLTIAAYRRRYRPSELFKQRIPPDELTPASGLMTKGRRSVA
jgi:hypothetical protein